LLFLPLSSIIDHAWNAFSCFFLPLLLGKSVSCFFLLTRGTFVRTITAASDALAHSF
jgi:hypothetical protein